MKETPVSVQAVDQRQSEADRAFALWCQRGAPPAVVKELLPMLVGPLRTQQAAERWLTQHALVGHDTTPEAQALDRRLVQQARALHQSALNSGAFAGHGSVFRAEPGRYGDATEAAYSKAMDEQTSPHMRAGQKRFRELAADDADRRFKRGEHSRLATTDLSNAASQSEELYWLADGSQPFFMRDE